MKKVIICEKPKLAKFIVSCITACMNEKFIGKVYNGSKYCSYFESPNYYVTFAMGHLFEAYDIEDYTKDNGEWTLDILPFYPPNNQFFYKLKQTRNKTTGKKETDPAYKLQFETISYLINKEDVNGIIHCGDAGREGEIIIRQIVNNSNKSNKPMVRLWLNAMAQNAFNEAFANMKPDSEYDNLASEGMARLKMDDLYGINLSRYITLKAKAPKGKPFRAGRVLCAMVREIYEREMEIEHFVPEKYYAIISNEETNGCKIMLRLKDHYSINEYMQAADQCALLNQSGAIVENIEVERKVIGAGKLFSLTTLQNKLSQNYKMSLGESMQIIQSVYEQGYITYPRTNAEHLPEHEKGNVEKLIQLFNGKNYELEMKSGKKIFDSTKVEDHGALLPTENIPGSLPEKEKMVYETVRNRFLAVFCKEECQVDKSVMSIRCGNELLKLTGSVLVTEGFLKYEGKESKDVFLPNLKKGDKVNINFYPLEETTKPPSRYSVSAFNDFLENPYKNEKHMDEERYEAHMKGLEIGTVASRTPIIGNMIKNGYVIEKNQVYYLQPAGRYLIEIMQTLGIDLTKEKTVESSILLKKIYNGELTENEAIEIVKNDINHMFLLRDKEIVDCISEGVVSESGFTGEVIGECPLCGGHVYEIKTGFICENNKKDRNDCNFYLHKEDKYIYKVCGKKLTSNLVATLLKLGYLIVKTKAKNGTEYETMIRLKMQDDNHIGWDMFFNIGKCPVCGGKVNTTPFGYICENNNQEDQKCYFVLFRKDKFIMAYTKKELTLKQAVNILNKGCLIVSVEKKDKSGKYKLKFTLNIDQIEKKISWLKEYVNK